MMTVGKGDVLKQNVEEFAAERYTLYVFFFQAEDGIQDKLVTGVQTCPLPILEARARARASTPSRSLRNSSRADRPRWPRPASRSRCCRARRTTRRGSAPPAARPLARKGRDRKSVVEGKSGDRGCRDQLQM